ncbi:MAG: hypothetical protein H6682_11015 [Candidatus Eisenbacteria bacterium]|nr:hypothetical protein [Candidatus Eisenbacteria bacterium]
MFKRLMMAFSAVAVIGMLGAGDVRATDLSILAMHCDESLLPFGSTLEVNVYNMKSSTPVETQTRTLGLASTPAYFDLDEMQYGWYVRVTVDSPSGVPEDHFFWYYPSAAADCCEDWSDGGNAGCTLCRENGYDICDCTTCEPDYIKLVYEGGITYGN